MTRGSEVSRLEAVDALWVVALISEVSPILSLLQRPRLRSHRLCVGAVGPHTVAVLRSGVGPAHAESRTRAALAGLSPRSVWSIGSCGAVDDALDVGDLISADRLISPDGVHQATTPVTGLPVHTIHTVTEPVFSPARRSSVRQTGATACEMEAAGVFQALNGRAPLHVVKVVSDRAGGEPDPAIDAHRAIAMARFHVRVERLVRQSIVPRLPGWLDAHASG